MAVNFGRRFKTHTHKCYFKCFKTLHNWNKASNAYINQWVLLGFDLTNIDRQWLTFVEQNISGWKRKQGNFSSEGVSGTEQLNSAISFNFSWLILSLNFDLFFWTGFRRILIGRKAFEL